MDQIIIVDAGGQYTHLIARNVRELGVYSAIVSFEEAPKAARASKGVVLSGGPRSVLEPGSPMLDREFFEQLKVPVLGICYGHQLLAHALGGELKPGLIREYGRATLGIRERRNIFDGLKTKETVWMSHGDTVVKPPDGFSVLASTPECEVAAMGNAERRFYGVQFHPEVIHTPSGTRILRNFVHSLCKAKRGWSTQHQVSAIVRAVRRRVGSRRVLFLISGGVDSTVGFTLAVKALGKRRVTGVYVDTGLMRKGETEGFRRSMAALGYTHIEVHDESERFLTSLESTIDPEKKRLIIGETFLQIYEDLFHRWGNAGGEWMLGQGTIYPDTIESGGTAMAAVIKTHHNRVKGVSELVASNRVVEPLAQLYKDEVRAVGRRLGLPKSIIGRLPFPGPGLAIRCLCTDREESIMRDGELSGLISKSGLEAWVLPIRSVGVQGDSRTYAPVALLSGRASASQLGALASMITNRIRTVNRVTYLVASRGSFSGHSARIIPAGLIRKRIDLLREADAVVAETMAKSIDRLKIWQFPVILIPLSLSGGETVVLRPVGSRDGMTAHFARLPMRVLKRLARRLVDLPGVDAVLYDLTHKPPGTIEWE